MSSGARKGAGQEGAGPWGCPCSAPLLMVNVTGQWLWHRLPELSVLPSAPGTACTLLLLFVCILAAPPWPLALSLLCNSQLLPGLAPSHPDGGFVGDSVTCGALV